MEYVTQGKKIHTDMIIDLFTKEKEVLAETCESSLRIILVEEGSLVLDFKGKPIFVESPALICLDNKVVLEAGMASQNHFPTIYFKPAVINSLFSYAFLETMNHDSLSQTEQQDIFWLHPFLSQESQGLTYVKLGPESMQRAKTLFSKMHKELNEQPDWLWPCRSRSIFLEFLYYMVSILQRYEEFKHEQLSSEDLFTQIQFYLHNHFQEDLSLEEVASRFHTNRTSLNALFVEATGKTVIAYLIELRIKLACLILRDTTVPVKEIVYRTGFNDSTHFGRTFKKHVSLTPSQYRENYNWMLK